MYIRCYRLLSLPLIFPVHRHSMDLFKDHLRIPAQVYSLLAIYCMYLGDNLGLVSTLARYSIIAASGIDRILILILVLVASSTTSIARNSDSYFLILIILSYLLLLPLPTTSTRGIFAESCTKHINSLVVLLRRTLSGS